ncbi:MULTISPECIES: type II toxin-antitoxin system Phd/YefM family antitoxin [Nocardiaceae]|nr:MULTISPECIES: type II toxin-antitoxin system Phd/YefM family antitoxin [Rhodococcus]
MTTLPVADARARLSNIVDDAERTHARYEITRNGHRVAVLLGADDFDALQETIAVLSDQELLASHVQGQTELTKGDSLDAEQLAAAMKAAGRSGRA